MRSVPDSADISPTFGTYPRAGFAELHCGRSDRLAPVLLVDARPASEQLATGLRGSVSVEQALDQDDLDGREVWLVLSAPLDLWAADLLSAEGADVVVVAHDLNAARGLGLTDPSHHDTP